MNPFITLVADMRQKKLWPLAALLVALLVALPIVLSKSASPVPLTSLPVPAGTATTPNVPSVSAQVNPLHSRLSGHERDPFAQTTGRGSTAKTATTTAKTKTTSSSGSGSGSSGSGSTKPASGASTSTTTTGSTSTTPTTPTTPTQPVVPLKPTAPVVPPGLTATEVYDVSFSITNTSGGFDTINSLQRLSVLPSAKQPLLVELGVLKGGNRVLFAVQPGASITGPGQCVPGPVDCAVVSLRPGQIESLAGSTRAGVVYAQFAVTKVAAHKLASSKAAGHARRVQSDAGRTLLVSSNRGVLSLFSYKPSIGALVDMRNLKVAG